MGPGNSIILARLASVVLFLLRGMALSHNLYFQEELYGKRQD